MNLLKGRKKVLDSPIRFFELENLLRELRPENPRISGERSESVMYSWANVKTAAEGTFEVDQKDSIECLIKALEFHFKPSESPPGRNGWRFLGRGPLLGDEFEGRHQVFKSKEKIQTHYVDLNRFPWYTNCVGGISYELAKEVTLEFTSEDQNH